MAIEGAGRLKAAIATLRDALGKEVEAQTLLALLTVAEQGEVPQADLQRELGIGASAMSRNIGLLGTTGYKNGAGREQEGLGLVESWENPMDRRIKLVRLTAKGKVLVNRATRSIGG